VTHRRSTDLVRVHRAPLLSCDDHGDEADDAMAIINTPIFTM